MAGGGGGEQELNLVPYLDIMVNLIMFLITITAYIAEMQEIPVLAPSSGGPCQGPDCDKEKPKPFLTIAVSNNGFAILGSDPQKIPAAAVQKKGNDFDFVELQTQLKKYKDQYDLAENIIIAADNKITYNIIVKTMDAARKDAKGGTLFAGITLGVAAKAN